MGWLVAWLCCRAGQMKFGVEHNAFKGFAGIKGRDCLTWQSKDLLIFP